RFVGELGDGLERVIAECGLGDRLQCTGFVSHEQALRYLTESDLLIHAGPSSAEAPKLRGIVPGKTFEYLGSGRPILFTGDAHSAVAGFLRPFAGVRIVAPGDGDAAKASFLTLLRQAAPPSCVSVRRFTSRCVTADLAKALNRIAS